MEKNFFNNESVNAVENNEAKAMERVTVEAAVKAVEAAKTPADVVNATEAALAVCKEERDVKAARRIQCSSYGIWHSDGASASELVSWCDGRLKDLMRWIDNVKALRAKAQSTLTKGMTLKELLSGYTPEELKAYVAEL